VDLYYLVSNAYAGLLRTKPDKELSEKWEHSQSVEVLLALRQALAEPAFESTGIVRKFQIRTNLANQLNSLGRCVEALEQWSLAIVEWPNFAMALGNRAVGTTSYARFLYDQGHQAIFLNYAAEDYQKALSQDAFWDSGPDDAASKTFRDNLHFVHSILNEMEFDFDFDLDSFSLGESEEEGSYREWCLNEKLFLNPLNDVCTKAVAARDVLLLPSHSYGIGETVRFPSYFNHLKQEYVTARFRLYDSKTSFEDLFVDKDVRYADSDDGGEFGYRVDQLKSAYRSAYSLFDKIGLFINDYFDIGVHPRQVNFRSIWVESEKGSGKKVLRSNFEQRVNWPLRGLYYLSKDLYDPDFSQFSSPDAKDLSELRNKTEHRFLTIYPSEVPGASTDTHSFINRRVYEAKTLRILKMARAAIIYLSMAMYREEALRKEN